MAIFRSPWALLLALVYCSAVAQDIPAKLTVAAVQMRSSKDLGENVRRIGGYIRDCASKGAQVVVFPECALSSYSEEYIKQLSSKELSDAEQKLAEVCKNAGVYAIVGAPYRDADKLYNSALVIAASGKVIERYHKMQLAERWPEPGDHMSVFRIFGVPCTVIICHDERYPELVRLPVLAGAQVVFYISHESGLHEEHKLGPYRAQIQARAVENTIYIVHANAPANKDAGGSHGQSRIIAPDGNILSEATIFGEDVLSATLDLKKATRQNARNSLNGEPLKGWWQSGIKKVRILD